MLLTGDENSGFRRLGLGRLLGCISFLSQALVSASVVKR